MLNIIKIRKDRVSSLLGLLSGLVVLTAFSGPVFAQELRGVWLTEDEEAALTIADCNGHLCGWINWLESATDRGGSQRLDEENPDPAEQSEPICGLVVITELERTGSGTWDAYVYNPQDGKTYSGRITVLSENELRVRAYIGLPIFGKSETWTRVHTNGGDGAEYICPREK